MNTLIAALLISLPLAALPGLATWITRRPMTELDRLLSRVDTELDAA